MFYSSVNLKGDIEVHVEENYSTGSEDKLIAVYPKEAQRLAERVVRTLNIAYEAEYPAVAEYFNTPG